MGNPSSRTLPCCVSIAEAAADADGPKERAEQSGYEIARPLEVAGEERQVGREQGNEDRNDKRAAASKHGSGGAYCM